MFNLLGRISKVLAEELVREANVCCCLPSSLTTV